MLSYSYEFWSISKLKQMSYQDKIDVNPVHQRPQRGAANGSDDKSIGIIKSLLEGQSLLMITLNHITTAEQGEYEYESLDGGHRKRAIMGFLDKKFKVNGKLFTELSQEEQDEFEAIDLAICVYSDLTGPQKAKIFRDLNKTTQVNEQENRNAAGDTPIANIIRNSVRPDNVETHKLFDRNSIKKSGKLTQEWKYLSFTNDGLKQEEWLARLYFYASAGKIVSCDQEDLDKFYDSNPSQDDVDVLERKVTKILNFVHLMAVQRLSHAGTGEAAKKKFRMDIKEANMFVRLWFNLNANHSLDLKGVDFKNFAGHTVLDFYNAVRAVMTDLLANYKTEFVYGNFDSRKYKGDQTIGVKFEKNLGEYRYDDVDASMLFPIQLVLSVVDPTVYLKLKATTRVATPIEKEDMLHKNGWKCPQTGVGLTWEETEVDHIIPHSVGIEAGGVHERHNLQAVSKTFNRAKSDKMPG